MYKLEELNRKDLITDVDTWTKDKSKKIKRARYVGITSDYVCYFKVPSVTADPPTTYDVKIKLLDYPEIADDEDLSVRDKVRLAITGDLKISCTCPAYLYFGYKYILTQLDTNESDDEHRFPKIKNPNLQGVMCKHCYTALSVFPMNASLITRDITNKNFMKR